MSVTSSLDPASLVRPELRCLSEYRLDLSTCRFKLDQNETPWELPRTVREAAARRLARESWARYPDFHADAVRERLAEIHDWPAAGILVGNGSNELLGVALEALAGPGTEVLGADPTFGLYRMMILRSGAVPRFLAPRPDLRLPRAELAAAIAEDPRRPLVLCSPNNPTGDALSPEELSGLLEGMTGPLLLDHAYGEFGRHDLRPLLDRYPHLILFRTLSKAWGLGGLRVGYLLAAPELVRELVKVKLPYNLGRAGGVVAEAALAASAAVERRIRLTLALREQWARMLTRQGLEVFPSEGNFLLVRVRSVDRAAAAQAVVAALAERSIRIRDVSHYPGLSGCLRVSVGSRRALQAVDAALTDRKETWT